MAKLDIVSVFRDYATSKGWSFWFGDDEYQNIFSRKMSNGKIDKSVTVLAVDFTNYAPTLDTLTGSVGNQIWTMTFLLGRKYDPPGAGRRTRSGLDEDTIDKWDRRIYPLITDLERMFEDLSCGGDLEFAGASVGYRINVFDPNIDAAFGTFTATNFNA